MTVVAVLPRERADHAGVVAAVRDKTEHYTAEPGVRGLIGAQVVQTVQ